MTWREFCVLLAGLSPRSLWALELDEDRRRPPTITEPGQLSSILGL